MHYRMCLINISADLSVDFYNNGRGNQVAFDPEKAACDVKYFKVESKQCNFFEKK